MNAESQKIRVGFAGRLLDVNLIVHHWGHAGRRDEPPEGPEAELGEIRDVNTGAKIGSMSGTEYEQLLDLVLEKAEPPSPDTPVKHSISYDKKTSPGNIQGTRSTVVSARCLCGWLANCGTKREAEKKGAGHLKDPEPPARKTDPELAVTPDLAREIAVQAYCEAIARTAGRDLQAIRHRAEESVYLAGPCGKEVEQATKDIVNKHVSAALTKIEEDWSAMIKEMRADLLNRQMALVEGLPSLTTPKT